MRKVRWSVLVVFLLLLGAPGVAADEGERRTSEADAVETALAALKIRLEARMKEGEVLSKTGRLDEALEAYRSVGDLYDQGMREVRALAAALRGSAPAAVPSKPGADRPFAGNAFPGRSANRTRRTRVDAEKSVDLALAWLAAHQSPNGGWEAAGFANWCNGKPNNDVTKRPDGLGKALYDVGVTGLATMAFLGAGHTHRGEGKYADTVSRALRYLRTVQDREGCFGPRATQQYMYNHAMASLAVIEAYGMTRSPVLLQTARRAIDFIQKARNPYMAWRYGVRPGDNDTSVTTWMVMCLRSASVVNRAAIVKGEEAPLPVDPQAFVGAKTWLDKVTDPDYGRVGYVMRGTGSARPQELVDRFPGEKSEAMTAAGILCRVFMGEDPRKSDVIKKGAQLCAKLPPVWNPADGSIDMYYWYYGTLAMYQVGGKHWQRWSQAVRTQILANQRLDTQACGYKGSWDPVGPWGLDGGRVYSTALLCMIAQVESRYDRVFGTK